MASVPLRHHHLTESESILVPLDTLISLIEQASLIAGSQRKLAALLDVEPSNLIEMKKGRRPCNWRVRGKLRAITGEDPTRAFIAAMAEDLENSTNPEEVAAALGFRAMLDAFPEAQTTKSPAGLSTSEASMSGGNGWFRQLGSAALPNAIHSTFCNMRGHIELLAKLTVGSTAGQVLSH